MDSQSRAGNRVLNIPTTLDYRLSKKVAELTQVVHLLFVKNHEKEMENNLLMAKLELLKEKEEENKMNSIEIQDRLENQKHLWEEEHRQLISRFHAQEERLTTSESGRQVLLDQITTKDTEIHDWQNKYFALQLNQEEDVNRLREQLTSLQNNVELQVRQYRELTEKHNDFKNQSEEKLNRSQHECQRFQSLLEINRKALQDLQQKTKEMENDLNNYRRENERLRASGQKVQIQQQELLSKLSQMRSNAPPGSIDEATEVEYLRQELQRYKLELFNRDQNFSRMFVDRRNLQQSITTNTSILLDNRAGRLASATIPADNGEFMSRDKQRSTMSRMTTQRAITSPKRSRHPHPTTTTTTTTATATNNNSSSSSNNLPSREKTFSYISSQSFDDDQEAIEELRIGRPISTSKLPRVNAMAQKMNNDGTLPKQRLF